ncbi:hypothetical protein MP638_005574 [Amoeboaphelidium occidentale]|nr:hypothetical protein MP638_005574 [Amoeboaphelidium occidentale]
MAALSVTQKWKLIHYLLKSPTAITADHIPSESLCTQLGLSKNVSLKDLIPEVLNPVKTQDNSNDMEIEGQAGTDALKGQLKVLANDFRLRRIEELTENVQKYDLELQQLLLSLVPRESAALEAVEKTAEIVEKEQKDEEWKDAARNLIKTLNDHDCAAYLNFDSEAQKELRKKMNAVVKFKPLLTLSEISAQLDKGEIENQMEFKRRLHLCFWSLLMCIPESDEEKRAPLTEAMQMFLSN